MQHAFSPVAKELTKNIPDFSKEIISALCNLIFIADSQIVEAKKWGMLCYSTKNGIVIALYPTKAFVTFTFYEGALLKDNQKLFNYGFENAHNRSIKFYHVKEVTKNHPAVLAYIKQAIENSKNGLKTRVSERTIEIPNYIQTAFKVSNIWEKFEKSTYTMKKEYIMWIKEAKHEETRARRIEKAVELLRKK